MAISLGITVSSCPGIDPIHRAEDGIQISEDTSTNSNIGETSTDSASKQDCAAVGYYDEATGLCWQIRQLGAALSRIGSTNYCAELSVSGVGGWRLPAIDELRSLIRGCPTTATGGACPVTSASAFTDYGYDPACNGCGELEGPSEAGCYWPEELEGDCGVYWSSTPADNEVAISWYISFDRASPFAWDETASYYARCVKVRSVE